MAKTQLICNDCGATYATAGNPHWSLEDGKWWHYCDGLPTRHSTREVTLRDDIVKKIPKAVPKKTRPKINWHTRAAFPSGTKKTKQKEYIPPWKPLDKLNFVSNCPTEKTKEKTTMDYTPPFKTKPHSYGTRVSDSNDKILCYIPKPTKKNPDPESYVLAALNAAALKQAPADPPDPEVKLELCKNETPRLPQDIFVAIKVIEKYVLSGEKLKGTILSAVEEN